MAVNTKIQFRRGYSTGYTGDPIANPALPVNVNDPNYTRPTASSFRWTNDIVLAEGEIGYEIDTGKFKIGRVSGGSLMSWVNLPYAGGSDIGIDIRKNEILYPGSGITLIEDPDSNAYAIYNILKNADNDTNISISNVLASGALYNGVDNVTGNYYQIGLADNLTNINNITISGTLNSSGIVGVTSNGTTLDIVTTLNKLIPPPPPTINTATLSMANIGLQLNRKLCSNITSTELNGNNNTLPITLSGGQAVIGVIFATGTNPGYYQTSYITGIGPGDAGTVSVIKNTVAAGQIDMTTGVNNGTNLDLTIANDRDYSIVNTNVRPGFHESFDVRATGLSSPGWNTVYISQSGTNTNSSSTLAWYYDNTNQLPVVSNLSVATGVGGTISYSSSIPHFSGNFDIDFDVQYLSSDTYVDNVVDQINNNNNTNAIQTISGRTRSNFGLTTPAPRNDASTAISLSVTGVTVTGAFKSVAGNSFSTNLLVSNSRGQTSTSINPNKIVLIKTLGATNTGTILREDNIPVGINQNSTSLPLGNGSGYGVRISGAANNVDTPSVTEAVWDSSATLGAGDAVVVGGVLKHDYTDYTNYIPAGGPNLNSGGRGSSTAQYFTFKITRASVSRLAIRIGSTTGIAGLWFKLPGTTFMDDALSDTNGWASAMVQYNSNGFSGDNIGCAEASVVPQNSPLANTTSYTITFGEANSSLTTPSNTIYVRIKLTNTQAIQSLFIHQA